MTIEILKADKRSVMYKDWMSWLTAAGEYNDKFMDEIELSPFDANEQCAVGFLAASASRAEALGLVEYSIQKKHKNDRRKNSNGRADLWIQFDSRSYSFECKRAWYSTTLKNLRATHNAAKKDISNVKDYEHDLAAACTIAYVRDKHRIGTYENFAMEEDIQFSCRLGKKGEGSTYLFFSIVGK